MAFINYFILFLDIAFGNMLKDINIQVDNTNPIYNTYVEADSVSTNFYDFSEFSQAVLRQGDVAPDAHSWNLG